MEKDYRGGDFMMEGQIKFFNQEKGYGFITGEDGKDYFVHTTFLPPDAPQIEGEEPVSFEPKETAKGFQAENIEFLE